MRERTDGTLDRVALAGVGGGMLVVFGTGSPSPPQSQGVVAPGSCGLRLPGTTLGSLADAPVGAVRCFPSTASS